jgi:hypothetical protein
MQASGDFSLVWSVARNFLSWIFSGKEDRVVSRTLSDAPSLRHAVNPEDARKALHSLPVLEAPRVNPNTAKPRHTAVKQAAAGQPGPLPVLQGTSDVATH